MSTTLTAYRVAPQSEHKAAKELREHGIKAYLPRLRKRRRSPFTGKFWPVAPGYVFAKGKASIAFAKHVKHHMGPVGPELANLYDGRRPEPQPIRLFSVDDKVLLADGPFQDRMGTVIAECGAGYMVKVRGRAFDVIVPMAQQSLRRYIDPG